MSKLVSWNINGVNACIRRGLLVFIERENADFYCFQEVKSVPPEIKGYYMFHNPAVRKGYSGVVTYSRVKPERVINGLGVKDFDNEGRVVSLEFNDFILVNVYFPHSRWGLERIDYKLSFNDAFMKFKSLRKPLIIAGDFNVAHTELDIRNSKSNVHNPGFTSQERDWMTEFLAAGFIDSFRVFVNDGGHYTWWTYRSNARARNIGWRIDYFLISRALMKDLINSEILDKITGSDHCPIRLMIKG